MNWNVQVFVDAANMEYATARANAALGDIYAFGQGVERDEDLGAVYWQRAVTHGDVESMTNLAYHYLRNRDALSVDISQVLHLYERAIELGSTCAAFNLGCLYRDGQFVEHDYARAVTLFTWAGARGDPSSLNGLAGMYDLGLGVAQNHTKAYEYYTLAAEAGCEVAMNNVGMAFYNGEGVPESKAEALRYFLLAGDSGNAVGDFHAGLVLLDGADGVDQDTERALACFRRAARAGHQGAEEKVSEMFEDGALARSNTT
mmetsp:Transcript_28384/g.49232  ORF Transcript_28384/g.49232 Transcript_28384/m.49232 type:complete len:259 (+) Transcript_28384:609-1385(+)